MGKEENAISLCPCPGWLTGHPIAAFLLSVPHTTAGGGDRRHGAYIHGEAKATPITSVIGLHYLVNSPLVRKP